MLLNDDDVTGVSVHMGIGGREWVLMVLRFRGQTSRTIIYHVMRVRILLQISENI